MLFTDTFPWLELSIFPCILRNGETNSEEHTNFCSAFLCLLYIFYRKLQQLMKNFHNDFVCFYFSPHLNIFHKNIIFYYILQDMEKEKEGKVNKEVIHLCIARKLKFNLNTSCDFIFLSDFFFYIIKSLSENPRKMSVFNFYVGKVGKSKNNYFDDNGLLRKCHNNKFNVYASTRVYKTHLFHYFMDFPTFPTTCAFTASSCRSVIKSFCYQQATICGENDI